MQKVTSCTSSRGDVIQPSSPSANCCRLRGVPWLLRGISKDCMTWLCRGECVTEEHEDGPTPRGNEDLLTSLGVAWTQIWLSWLVSLVSVLAGDMGRATKQSRW